MGDTAREEASEGIGELRSMLERNDLEGIYKTLKESTNPATLYFLLSSGSTAQRQIIWNLAKKIIAPFGEVDENAMNEAVRERMDANGLTMVICSSCVEEYYDGTWPLTGMWLFREPDIVDRIIRFATEHQYVRSRNSGDPPDPTERLDWYVDFLIQNGGGIAYTMPDGPLTTRFSPEPVTKHPDRNLGLTLEAWFDDDGSSFYRVYINVEGLKQRVFTGEPRQDG